MPYADAEKNKKCVANWKARNPDKIKEYNRERAKKHYYEKVRPSMEIIWAGRRLALNELHFINMRKTAAQYKRGLKILVMRHYSNGTMACACCGETILDFLTLDHPNNDGKQHRASLGKKVNGGNYYLWLVKHNFPFRHKVLCYNCNLGRKHGTCPHWRFAEIAPRFANAYKESSEVPIRPEPDVIKYGYVTYQNPH